MRPQFANLMTHSLTVRKRERDFQGSFQDVITTPDVPGFIQYGKRLITDRKGEETVASAIIFLRNDAPVDTEHPHWIIDQDAPQTRAGLEVIRIDPIDDPRTGNTHHFEVAVR